MTRLREDAMHPTKQSPSDKSGTPDPVRSRAARKRWQQNRSRMLSGIKKYARSARGRSFYSKLGRFNSTHSTREAVSSQWTALLTAWEQLIELVDGAGPELREIDDIIKDAYDGAAEEAEYSPEPAADAWEFLGEVHADLLNALRDDTGAMLEAVLRGRPALTVFRETAGG